MRQVTARDACVSEVLCTEVQVVKSVWTDDCGRVRPIEACAPPPRVVARRSFYLSASSIIPLRTAHAALLTTEYCIEYTHTHPFES